MKKHLLIFIALLLATAVFSGAAVFAQPLEIQYPQLPGAQLSQEPLLPDFIKYLYTFAVLAAGFLAVGSAVYGGFRYIASGGSPTAQGEARAQITGGILGFLVVLCGLLFLWIINPHPATFMLEKPNAQIQIPTRATCDCLNPTTDQCKKTCEQATSNFLEI